MLNSVTLLSRKFGFDLTNAGVGRIATELKAGLLARGINVLTRSSDDNGSNYQYMKFHLLDLARNHRTPTDVYHAITPFEALYLPKDKSIVTICDLIPMTHPEMQGAGVGYSWWKRNFAHHYFTLAAKVAARCRYVVTISELSKQEIIEHLKVPEAKVKIIRLGIPEYLRPEPKPDDVFRIGYLGQLDRRKRVDLLVKAFRDSNIDGELAIGGIGRDGAMLKALAGDDNRIMFLGFVPNEKLNEFYNSLSVFCFPTMAEGLGLPILEAMACRKPVVVLEDSIITPELKSRCYVVPEITDIFNSPIQSEVENRLGVAIEECRENSNYAYTKSYSWSNTVSDYIKLYEEVVGD